MRAIRVAAFGGIENLTLESNYPLPAVGKKEVLIKVSAAGVNPVETYIRSGMFALLPELPYTPGSDAAGVVQEVGSEVTRFKKGDRVCTVRTLTGSYAEYTTAEDKFVVHLSDKLSFAQGAAIGIPYYTAVKALQIRAKARSGERCLIHGASGAVGIAAIQFAKAMGLHVIGTAGTKEGMALVKNTGADLVFNHREDGYVKAIQDAIGGVDIILEMASHVNLQRDLDLVNTRGRVVVIGCRGNIEINPTSTMAKESCIMGVNLMEVTDEDFHEMHHVIRTGMEVGWLDPKVSKVYPLGEAKTAQHDVINNQGTTGKLVLDTTK
ncbi:hypothetical protein EGW08_009954 [Elysia chlorotica]|uniref:Enoyl reductase (ER) domain-containing protein n=1 Tax=Elysia chlorotica TaxID=188477 RepID=A0A433TLA6_ELYCH|nr:hypothetical protein EGW08_009954 [Elysia chlorotica]